jgi:predicted metal-dependent peptidase
MTQGTYDYDRLNRELDRAKSAVLRRKDSAFFGPLLCSLDFEWKPGLDTAATDGKKLMWDPADFERLPEEGRAATIMHELWHNARLHILRRGSKCPDVWFRACDIWINRAENMPGFQMIPPELWLIRPDLNHLETEEDIYDWLISPGGGGMKPHQSNPGHAKGKCTHGKDLKVTPQIQQKMINSLVKAKQSAKMSGMAGSVPGDTESILSKFLDPIIPWETKLQNFFTDLLDEDYSWARPDRRLLASDMYLPSRFTDEGRLAHIMFFEDVSGSITEAQSLRFNSELKYVWETFQPEKLTIIQFDTRITKIDVLNDGDPFNEIRIVGGGGTCLVDVRKHIMDNRPTAVIIFSDLWVTPMLPGPECPVLWVAIGNTSAQVNFGEIIHIGG